MVLLAPVQITGVISDVTLFVQEHYCLTVAAQNEEAKSTVKMIHRKSGGSSKPRHLKVFAFFSSCS